MEMGLEEWAQGDGEKAREIEEEARRGLIEDPGWSRGSSGELTGSVPVPMTRRGALKARM